MARHSLYQIPKAERELATRSVFYGLSDAFTQFDARKAFIENKYNLVAYIEADDLETVRTIINKERETSNKFIRLKPFRDIGISDLIYDSKTKRFFIVGPDTFDRISIPAAKITAKT